MEKHQIFSIVTENIKTVLPFLKDHKFNDSDRLVDLGANSVDRVEIVAMTLEDIALHLPLLETSSANNLGELVDFLHAKI
ncbi:acyl carrier protein [Xenorhabdus bovienii]|uniref:acyl carrier protein n=1 Tax=Xenorhabdus bovienii TaxID=40576 RepID=UPI0023B2F3AB|nr:acyl carrier protein [Xenorhabdus bovienii]MDE9482425.1 acyl carrier protein [Xenorhabdus bovienii]MDE9556301.1 acyl carrier protein [Xenorhabdus bovienii]